ncbi:hypothetical protein CK203_106921 [Vitis vinifera]|uniref:Uncharacterized protein n=1 Tax=Vitis vinifera TaxID=29760 RepID=A0A438CDW4_VITVI|nr:hypothetical protein CK203_106921 [Vitis vinifera]
MQEFKSQPLKRKIKKGKKENWLPVVSPSQPIFPFVPSLPSFSTCSLPLSAPLFPFFPLFSSIAERLLLRLLLQLCLVLSSPDFSILISTLLHRLVGCVSCSHLHTPPYSDLHSSSTAGSERDGLEVVRNPKRPIGAWIHYYNDQLAMMKEKDKGVKINDDLYLQTRCSPERVIRVIENLEPKQKAAIEEIGFGSLLQLRYIDSIKKMNWAEFVLSYLVHGIEEFKKKQQSGVCGCLLFLMRNSYRYILDLLLGLLLGEMMKYWIGKRRLKKLGGYANENLKIWVIENEIRDCVDGNATTMASENEDDEKFVSNLNKDVIKRVDGGNLMEMDKTFQQLKTHLLDMAYGASSSSCDQILAKFEENYTTVKGLFLRSSGKPLRMHEEGTKNDMLSCERSLEDTNNMNVNEHYLHTLSNEKLCTEDLNEKNEDACATSIEVHIIPDENQNILPLPIKKSRRDYGKEPLRALCVILIMS